jgi:hypothetical protein
MTTYSTLLTERTPTSNGGAVLKITTNRPGC